MSGLADFWTRSSRGTQLGLVSAAALIVALGAMLAFWALRTPYEVLFSQLAERDAAAIVEHIKQRKIPYQLAEGGTTIKVPTAAVHETRLALMASSVPIMGGVGFELFDKQGLGATEQSQRVSYQRALQGELARTIGALDDVQQARVHLVLPESTLFKRDRQEARAAVTLTVAPGGSLDRDQIAGIQRLVAASVAGLESGKVVIVDQRGMTLSMADAIGGGAGSGDARLDMKRGIEDYITRKIVHLLDNTYGPGQALVSVDVQLNFDEVTRTVRDVLPVSAAAGAESTGVRRRRQVVTTANAPAAGEDIAAALSGTSPQSSSTDVEFEYGQRVEQVIAAPGGVTRLSVGVVVPGDLSVEKQQRITELVSIAAGVNARRGDAIVVQTLSQLGGKKVSEPEVSTPLAPQVEKTTAAGVTPVRFLQVSQLTWSLFGALALAIVALAFAWRRSAIASRDSSKRLTAEERQRLLLEVQRTLGAVTDPGAKA